jgi:hypothetical protein
MKDIGNDYHYCGGNYESDGNIQVLYRNAEAEKKMKFLDKVVDIYIIY